MDELIKFQQSVIETMNRENQKCTDLRDELNLDEEIKLASIYKSKLDQITRDITSIRNRSEKIKKRALKLQELKQKEALKAVLNKDKQKQLDEDLVPVVLAKNRSKKKDDKIIEKNNDSINDGSNNDGSNK